MIVTNSAYWIYFRIHHNLHETKDKQGLRALDESEDAPWTGQAKWRLPGVSMFILPGLRRDVGSP